ncbi:MAG: ABC transporter permease, partial [Gammaproteobacteria bacterium]|nr:ABC transporter permease [Gammaproteobacteria bacterium]
MALKSNTRSLAFLLGPTTLFLGICFLGPLAVMLVYSFLEPGLYGGVEWNFYHLNYGRILGWADGEWEDFDPVYAEIFLRSVRIALTNVLITLVICYPAALWVSGLSPRWRTLIVFLVTLPFFVSMVVRLFAWVLILRPSGFLNASLLGLGLISEPIDIIFTETAVLIGMAYVLLPFMFLPIYASVEKLDHSLIEASSDLGGNSRQTFLRVILPLTLPGIAAGSVLVFIPSLGNFIVPDILGGAKVMMIGNLVEQQFLSARNWPFGAALSVMIMVVMF